MATSPRPAQPTPTRTAPTATAKPTQAQQTKELVKARISHYTPWTGGPNCASFVNGVCVSRMASGKPWQDWIEKACACPKEYPFGTRFVVDGKEWICLDRGGKITIDSAGVIWLDLLTAYPKRKYGEIVTAEVKR